MSALLGHAGLLMAGQEYNTPTIACAYPMDADQAELDAIYGGRPKMQTTDNGQTGIWLLTDSPASFQQSVLMRSRTAEGRPDLNIAGGKKIVELVMPTLPIAVDAATTMSRFAVLNSTTGTAGVIIHRGLSSNIYELSLYPGGVTSGLSTVPTVFGFGFDFTDPEQPAGTCNLTVWADGAQVHNSPAFAIANTVTPALSFTQSGAAPAESVGMPVSASWVTNAADMVGTYPPGWTDVCGNSFGNPIACAYPLDATPEELDFDEYSPLTADEDGLTYSLTLQGEGEVWGSAAPAGFTTNEGATVAIDSGKKAFQVRLTTPLIETAGTEYGACVTTFKMFDTSADTFVMFLYVQLQADFATAGYRYLTLSSHQWSTTIYTDNGFPGETVLLTLEFDCDAGTLAMRVDGELVELSDTSFTPSSNLTPMADVGHRSGLDEVDIGKVASVKWITSAADMTGPITEGYTDICGNPI